MDNISCLDLESDFSELENVFFVCRIKIKRSQTEKLLNGYGKKSCGSKVPKVSTQYTRMLQMSCKCALP